MLIDDHNSQSSLYVKLTPDERLALDRAIARREPSTYRALYAKFDLKDRGVSFTAFYRYARRIRRLAEAVRLNEALAPSDGDTRMALGLDDRQRFDGAAPRPRRPEPAQYPPPGPRISAL